MTLYGEYRTPYRVMSTTRGKAEDVAWEFTWLKPAAERAELRSGPSYWSMLQVTRTLATCSCQQRNFSPFKKVIQRSSLVA